MVINVKDVNDNPPVFDRPTYETQITEEDDRNLPKRVLQVNNNDFRDLNVLSSSFAVTYLRVVYRKHVSALITMSVLLLFWQFLFPSRA